MGDGGAPRDGLADCGGIGTIRGGARTGGSVPSLFFGKHLWHFFDLVPDYPGCMGRFRVLQRLSNGVITVHPEKEGFTGDRRCPR